MDQEEKEHYRFRELMIRNKDKRLYRSMMKSRNTRVREAKRLESKRKQHEKEAKESKSQANGVTAKWSVQPVASDTPSKKMKKTL